ncbi:MAG TPA: ABC transporter substrate-binding protein, partial [Stellaceae bacterium]|nr:ABC transporter substrate-binding protein [Stellaceae bacterium]
TSNDPVAIGLVASLARPGGNLTGVSLMQAELMPKLLELLLEPVPRAGAIALLLNPNDPYTPRIIGLVHEAAQAKRVDLRILRALTASEIDAAFAALVELRADGLVLAPIGFRPQIAALASRHAVPAIDLHRDFAMSGGLLGYGPNLPAVYHLKGIYAGRILKGARPADLPVQQPTKFELVVNLKTAEALRLKVPPSLLARASEVIE